MRGGLSVTRLVCHAGMSDHRGQRRPPVGYKGANRL